MSDVTTGSVLVGDIAREDHVEAAPQRLRWGIALPVIVALSGLLWGAVWVGAAAIIG